MSTTSKVSLASAGLLTALTLVAFAPAADADEGFYSRNGADRAAAGISNGNGFSPTTASPSDGFDTSDAAIGAMAGLVAAGAGVIAVGTARRHHGQVMHPA
jgi:hypothetical protein